MPSKPWKSDEVPNDFLTEVRKGNIDRHDSASLLGHSDQVGTTSNVVWNDSGAYVFPSGTPQTMTVSSSSTDDNIAGTGTGIVLIDYIDRNWDLIEKLVTLTGQTGVTIADDVRYVNRIRCVFSGSGQVNAGIIYAGTGAITNGVPATVYAKVLAGEGLTRSAIYVVPAGHYMYIQQTTVSSYTSGKQLTITLEVMADQTNTWLTTTEYHMARETSVIPGGVSKGIPPKTLVRYRAAVDTGTADLSVLVGYLLIKSSEVGAGIV